MNEKLVEGIADFLMDFFKNSVIEYIGFDENYELKNFKKEVAELNYDSFPRFKNWVKKYATAIAERLVIDEEKIKEILTLRKVECLGETIADIIINKPIKVKERK